MKEPITWEPKWVKVADLVENPANPKILNEKGKGRLQKTLSRYGLAGTIVVNQDLSIVDGHSRKKEMQDQGVSDVWVSVPSRLLTEKEYKELNAVFDLAKAGDPDMLFIEEEFGDEFIQEWDLEKGMKADAMEDEYEIPEDLDQLKTKIVEGDLIEIGQHRLICGDCRSPETLKALFGDQQADIVVTDPPYNVAYVGKTKKKLIIEGDRQQDDDFYTFLFDFYTALGGFTKAGGAWYVFHADSEGANFRKAMADSGIMVKQCLIWLKNVMVMGRQDYQWKHEPILYGWKEGAAHSWYSDRTQTTILEFDRPSRSAEHPTIKPIALLSYLINNSSKSGDLVSDGFLGSGSTMVTCQQLGRKCYAVELDPRYCQVTIDRMRMLEPDIAIKINGEEI